MLYSYLFALFSYYYSIRLHYYFILVFSSTSLFVSERSFLHFFFFFFFLMIRPPPRSTLFPYPTLFRSLLQKARSSELLPRSLVDVVMRCLAKKPEDRWASAEELALALEPFTGRGPAIFRLLREARSEEHTSELQSLTNFVCRLLLAKKKDARGRTRRRRSPSSSTPCYASANSPATIASVCSGLRIPVKSISQPATGDGTRLDSDP